MSDEVTTKLQETVDTNLMGLVNCTREAFKIMKKHDDYGYIININRFANKFLILFFDE